MCVIYLQVSILTGSFIKCMTLLETFFNRNGHQLFLMAFVKSTYLLWDPLYRTTQQGSLYQNCWINILYSWEKTNKQESLLHLFYECEQVKRFLTHVEKFMNIICDSDLSLTKFSIIFGCNIFDPDPFINYIILLGKSYIYRKRYSGSRLIFHEFKGLVHFMFQVENYIAIASGNLCKHNKKKTNKQTKMNFDTSVNLWRESIQHPRWLISSINNHCGLFCWA